jgi:catechol 2,3-dioxygenase-like lactoylglutathione lyase family enzyme
MTAMGRFDHLFIHPSDFDKSVDFYERILHLEKRNSWGDGGEPRGVILSDGDFTVVLAERHTAHGDQSWDRGVSGTRPTIHLKIKDIESAFSQMERGEHVLIEPEATHWGALWFVVADPDGNIIAFNEEQGT